MHLKHTFETMELDDQIVAVPVGERAAELRGVIKMNETSAFIFECLKTETSEEAIVDALSKEYNAPLQVLKNDVHQYIESFRKRGLLIE